MSTNSDLILKALLSQSRTPHFHAIGEFLVEFSRLEYLVKVIYYAAIGADTDTFDLVTTQPIRSLLTATSTLSKIRFGETAAAPLLKVFSQVQSLADERNHIAHAHWNEDSDGFVGNFVSNNKLTMSAKYRTVAEIREETEKARKLSGSVVETFLELNHQPRITPIVPRVS